MSSNLSWPFREAKKILEHSGNKKEIILEAGYGPSGLPHIGTFGEVFRTTVVMNAIKELAPNIKVRLIVVSDDMDGLRKVPDNVPNQKMLSENLDKSLTSIPDPFGICESYGHYMNAQLCKFLDLFEFEYEFKSATECYKSGIYDEKLLLLLKNYDKIMEIMLPSLGEERQKTYSPFLPICSKTGKVLQVPVIERNLSKGTITYKNDLGEVVETQVTGGRCKLQWKPDWGMRWAAFKVDYEAHGKDLTPSAVLSSQICSILAERPPLLFCYELFLDKEGKKISKSKGNGVSIEEWLYYAPSESLAFYIFQNPKKAKRLYFDIIPKFMDEYLEFVKRYHENNDQDNPVWHIHKGKVPKINIKNINFTLLLNLAAACNAENKDILWGFISRYIPDATPESNEILDKMISFATQYYHDFVKPNKVYKIPNDSEKEMLTDLIYTLKSLPDKTTAEEVQTQIFNLGKKYKFENLRDWFKLLYKVLFGQETGPRMGSFIMLYGINNTISLIEEAKSRPQ
ncbi:MAG: lysine--tRNA ligase [Wolbachia endosymbiont of Xenopsylla cheopis]